MKGTTSTIKLVDDTLKMQGGFWVGKEKHRTSNYPNTEKVHNTEPKLLLCLYVINHRATVQISATKSIHYKAQTGYVYAERLPRLISTFARQNSHSKFTRFSTERWADIEAF